MRNDQHLRKIIICAVCIAFCVVLPLTLRVIPQGGQIFSPMHIPVFICGLACGPVYGGVCGIIGVVLSSVIFQMPPAAVAMPMAIELLVYGVTIALFYRVIRTKTRSINIYISLVLSMLCGRVVWGILQALIFSNGSYSVSMWITSYFVISFPGIIAHLIIVPAVYFALKKARVA